MFYAIFSTILFCFVWCAVDIFDGRLRNRHSVLAKCGIEGSCVENFVKFSRKKCFRLHFFINLVSGKHFLLRAVFSRNFRCKSPHFSNTFPVSTHPKRRRYRQQTNRKMTDKKPTLRKIKRVASRHEPTLLQHI